MYARAALVGLSFLLASPVLAQPQLWWPLDLATDGVYGMSVPQAYEALDGMEPQRTIVVAVIDSGVDIAHEDFLGRIWTNEDEVAGNGLDDDGNGYTDDINGWNFIGGADGQNIDYDSFEIAREVASLRARFEGQDGSDLDGEDAEAFARLQQREAELEERRTEYGQIVATLESILPTVRAADASIKSHLGQDSYTMDDVQGINSPSAELQQAKQVLLFLDSNGLSAQDVEDQLGYVKGRLDYGLNPDFDPRAIVGDDYDDYENRSYGNPDLHGPDPSHGTAVSGVIGAVRGNDLGIDGIAPNVLIMPIRAVPNGDERDKDIANAIRYAVDNGAHLVNMSFGKDYSPQKSLVDEAVRYAEERGVLLIHAAGNDGADLETTPNFPGRRLQDGIDASNWIEVGASTHDETLAAPFSNYGTTRVDVFAPGASIYSLEPGNGYAAQDGTSLAAPLVTGVAALVMSYFPDLDAMQVRQILLDSAVRYTDQTVPRPGAEDGETVPFGELSVTGGIVNALEAVKMAQAMVN